MPIEIIFYCATYTFDVNFSATTSTPTPPSPNDTCVANAIEALVLGNLDFTPKVLDVSRKISTHMMCIVVKISFGFTYFILSNNKSTLAFILRKVKLKVSKQQQIFKE